MCYLKAGETGITQRKSVKKEEKKKKNRKEQKKINKISLVKAADVRYFEN